ncbi:xanthine dehydrogenase family protein molybdopterin-binding subunit [Pseudomonas oryzihabitans]|uniref:xanthine dehydrogenase family protein molybdopterin-binding subunit n=1 Tax=Pseudomonas oryzihabitans TaxID=47885 RepID=UPI00241CD9BE|nr:xanthine dehydrogenase family protein molybdopterin-binding subunit [Pseudomonas oryzihabitans]
MEMNEPAGRNLIDENRGGLIGKPIDRVDGLLKVTGQAPYSFEFRNDRVAYGFIVGATIAKGRISRLDTSAAEGAPGVLSVLTYRNAPRQAAREPDNSGRFTRPKPYLDSDQVRYFGEPVAFVVAETFEEARLAAALVEIDYAAEPGVFDLAANLGQAVKPPDADQPTDTASGDVDAAFARAPIKLDERYTTPYHIHAQMEPHASLAQWDGDRVTIYCSTQFVEQAQSCVANTLQLPKENVRIVARYIGGGFGGKLPIYADALIGAMAARAIGRPVKVTLTRQQMFQITDHRSATIQRIRLGADREGRIQAMAHEGWSHSARGLTYYEPTGLSSRTLYAGDDRLVAHRMVELDLPESGSCRAPGEAVGMLASESAMDELAVMLGLDPIELRIRNEPSQDPEKHIPFSSRKLVECMQDGARRFGWSQRKATPGQVREGDWLIGMGMAAASRANMLRPSQAGVRLEADGSATVKTSMTDIGTGTYTILAQIAGESLGLPVERVKVLLGDSDDPAGAGSGGSFGAASSGSSVYVACENLRLKAAEAAGLDPASARFVGGRLIADNGSRDLAELARQHDLQAIGEIKPGQTLKEYSQQGYGAFFAEVGVHALTGEIRLRRMLGVFAAGRILNEKTAHSQMLGGMIWGVGSALHEDGVIDVRHGHFVNHDLADYHYPCHLDIPAIEAHFLPEVDDKANPLKIKGVGELGICGAGAALTNAVYNACGVRIRDYPLTVDKVLAGLKTA